MTDQGEVHEEAMEDDEGTDGHVKKEGDGGQAGLAGRGDGISSLQFDPSITQSRYLSKRFVRGSRC